MNKSYVQHRRRMRLLAMFFIALYALASGRSLVPGMCATQAALDREGASIAAVYCCERPGPIQPHNDDRNSPRPMPETRCAFCQLALAASLAEPLVTLLTAEVFESTYVEQATAELRFAAIADTNIGRDPPAVLS